MYEASATLIIDPFAPQVLQGVKDVVELGTGTFWANREFYETQYRIILSTEMALRVAARLGMTAKDNQTLAGRLLGQTKVNPLKDSRVVSIAVKDTDPARAALIANTFAEEYLTLNLDQKVDGARYASGWLGDQIVKLAGELKRSEAVLYEFRKDKQLLDVDLDTRQGMTTNNLQTYNVKLADVRAKRIEAESIRKQILEARTTIEGRETIPAVRNNVIVQQLRGTYVELRKLRSDLEAKYGDKHPRVVALDRQIETVGAEYRAEMDRVLSSHEIEFKALLENEKALQQLMDKEKKAAIELAQLEVEYRPLFRNAQNNIKLFDMVTQREKETNLTGLIRTNNVRILEPALPPKIAIQPRPVFNLAIALALGTLLGIAVCVGLDFADSSLRNQEEVEELLEAPVLGMVPVIGDVPNKRRNKKVEPAELKDRDLAVHQHPTSSAAEACRSIRTNLLFISPDKPLRSLVVTSPGPQEGKTTTAISLAITMAQAGSRVLLVDTDLRRPRLHRSFSMPNEKGVTSLIASRNLSLPQVVRTSPVPNLDLLLCGPVPPNPAELLHTKRFTELIAECVVAYDLVIFDSPPTSAVTDPAIIGNLVDGALLVVRAGKTSRPAAMFAKRQLADAKANVVGVVINHVDVGMREYNYYYSRYYREYGKYGYSASEASEAS